MLRRAAIASCAAVLCAWAIVGVGACAPYAAPKLTVQDAAVTERTSEGSVIRFTLDAKNVNRVELPLKRIRYRLSLGGQEVFRGVRSPQATLRRLGTQQITLPTVLSDEERARLQGEVPYRLQGVLMYTTPGSVAEILFDAGVRRPRVRFNSQGVLDFGDSEG